MNDRAKSTNLAAPDTSPTQVQYSAAVETWRFFAAWREKIIGGYLVVLAGLAAGFSHYQSPGPRCAVLGGAVVASVVFWILDVRNVYFLNVSQAAAARLEDEESPGCFTALETRLDPEKKGLWASIWMPTYAQAIDLLVASVVAGSLGCLYILLNRLRTTGHLVDSGVPVAATIAAATLASLMLLSSYYLRTKAWEGEKTRRETRKSERHARRAVEQPDAV